MKGGVYQFVPGKLGEAHAACMRLFIAYLSQATHPHFNPVGKEPIVIVDNTNTTVVEIAPYYSVAKAFGYDVEIVLFDVDPQVCTKRNTHDVPWKSIVAMHDRIQRLQKPHFWDVKWTEVLDQEETNESSTE